jgi:hypothetical protein
MKTVTILAIVWLCFAPIEAQQIIEKHMNFSGKESLSLKIQIADSINIQTWSKDEVYVKASVNINENKDNEAYVTSFDETGKTLIANANFRDKYFKGRNNCCNKTDIFWQVFIPEKVRFSVETINADVTITGQTSSMNIKNISGYIDLAVPADKKADLEFSTVTGTMYSNHNLALNKTHSGIPLKINEKLNGGGDMLKLETVSGDIFFRKSE